jgi:hypothetical protein
MKEVQKLLKMVADGLKTLAQGVEAIAEKVDETAKTKSTGQAESKKQSTPVKTPKPVKKATPKVGRKKAAKPATAVDTVLNIISSSSKGANTAAIRAETGYDQKKISNIVYKLKKQGKIKAIQKGVYLKA